MRKIFWFVLMTLLGINSSYGQWNSKDLDPEEYYMYHNDAKGDNENTCLVLLTVNGKWLTQEELSDYAFYVVGYYEENFGTPKKPKWVTVCESFGTCQITNLGETASFSPTLGANPDLGTSDETDPDYDPATDPTLWSLYTDFAVSNAGKSNLSISCLDYTCGTSLVEFEVVIVNTKTGYYGKSEVLPGTTQNVEINIVDPTLTPSTGPTITVEPIIAGCWSDGGTFDLTKAKKNVSDGATVEYYTDESGNVPIPDPTKVAMPANPSSPTQVVKYYAKAISADGTEKSDIQEISVTFYQKPDVSLALEDGATKACYGTKIKLVTDKKNGFTDGTYEYYSGNAALVGSGGSSYETVASASTTYFVYVTSGATVGSCKDTASTVITVPEVISGGHITISVSPDKSEICAGQSLDLTASVTEKYTGTITYKWGDEVAVDDRTKSTVTVKPSKSQTEYTVDALLDGCPASGKGSKIIYVNPLPVLTIANPAAVCGGTVDITQSGAAGTYKYYSDAELTSPISNVAAVVAGDYYVTLTDAKGCTSEKGMVTAVVNPNPTPKILVNGATPTEDELCAGTEIKLSCDNNTYETYTWTGVADATDSYEQNAKIVAGASNSFGLTVEDANGCKGPATTVAITGKAAPTVTIDPVAAACKGDEVTLKANITWVTGEQSILWKGNNIATDNAATTTATLNGQGNKYDLTITDKNSCQANASTTVQGNVIEATGLSINPKSVKASEIVNLDITAKWNNNVAVPADNISYTWKKTVSASESTIANTKAATDAPNANSTYKIVVEKNGCKDSVSGDVTVETDPFELAGIDGYRAVCDREDLSTNPVKLYVTASGGQTPYTYKWTYPAGMTVDLTNPDTLKITSIDYTQMSAGGSYAVSVVVEDAIGAKDPKTIPFEVRELPKITINGENGGAILQACKAGVMNLQASVSNGTVKDYLWSTGGTSAAISAPTNVVGTTSYIVTATTDVGCSNKDSVKVKVNELPEIKLIAQQNGLDVSQVCTKTEITLNATVTGVATPSLVWSKGAAGFTGSTPKTEVKAETSYEVAYRDPSTTCEAKTEVNVKVFPVVNLAVSVVPGSNVCAGSEVTFTAKNGASYQWLEDGVNIASATAAELKVKPTKSVTYTVTGKDANGCEATPISAPITIIPAPQLVLSKTTLDGCVGGPDVDLAAAVAKTSTQGIPLKVRNSKGDILTGTTVNTSGVYTLFLDNGSNSCSSNEEEVKVIFHDKPNVSFEPDIAEVCSGDEVTLTASSTDTPLPTFTYGGTNNTTWKVKPENTGSVNTSITYTVTAKDSYGCTNTADAEVTVKPLPKVKIADPGAVCEASQVTLSAEGATTYAWSGAAQSGNAPTYEVQPTSKVYKFYVIGTDENGCKGKDSITLTVNKVPELAEAKPFIECNKTKINLAEAFVVSYTLSFFDENQDPISGSNIIVDGDKTYYAKASNENCTSEFAPIPVTAKPLPSVSIEEIGEICAGGEVELKASGENIVSYLWSPAGKGNVTSGATITANPSVTTEYIVTARGNNNCTNTDTVKVIVNPLPEIEWDPANVLSMNAGETKVMNVRFKKQTTEDGNNYTWFHNGAVDNKYPNSNYSLIGKDNPEILEVCVTDGKGCTSDTLKTSVKVIPQGGDLTITLDAESKEICEGGMQILTVTHEGGWPLYKYVWYKVGDKDVVIAQDVTSITVTEAGTYKVSVTDGGVTQQTKEASIEVKISNSLTAPVVTVADLTIPAGNSTILLPTVTPANGSYTYQWSEVANLKDADQATLVNPETKILTSDTPYNLVVKDGNGCYSKKATGTVHVDDANGFKVVASVDLNKVCLDNPAQLNATLHGKVSENVTYEWIPATGLSATDIANPVFSSANPGKFDFIVKVTDITSGSVAVAKVTVEAENKTAPTLALAPASGNSCVGEAITVTADGVSEYQWIIDGRDPIVGGNSLDTLVAGNRKVKVTATATNGCVITPVEGNYQIHERPTIAFDPNTPNKVDKGTVLTVTAIADNGASGNYTYTWSSPSGGTAVQNTYTINVGNGGKTFKVSVKNNATGCVSEEITKAVTVQTPTSPVEITVNSESVLLCLNGISLLEVTGVKGGNGIENEFSDYRYEWTKSGNATVLSTEKSYTATADGTYTVKVTEPNTDKSTTKDITVTNSSLSAPLVANATLTIQKDQQAFLFAKVTGGTPDYAYCWTPLSSLSTANSIPNPTTSALSAPESFTCYVTDANGCSGKGDIQVNVVESTDPKLFTLVAKADNNNPCMGNTVNLTATPSRELVNATYEWTPATGLSAANIANPVFTPASSGETIYTVKVTEQGGYTQTARVAVTVQSSKAPQLALVDNTGGCAGEELIATNTIENVTVTKYHWVIDGTPDIEKTGETYPLGAGAGQTVKVYATADNGCASDTASGVFSRKPTPEIKWDQNPTSAKEGEDFTLSVTADDVDSYKWSLVFTPEGGVAQPAEEGMDQPNFKMSTPDKGTYAFTVYVEKDGCKSKELTNTVTVLDKDAGLTVNTDLKGVQQICANGSIIVTATAFNGSSGNYTFNWYEGTTVSGNPVATGATVVLSPTVNGQKYVVEVNDGNTTALSSPITLTFNNNTAPTIAGGTQNVAAGQSTILLSKVTQGTAASYHWSSPNDLLVSGDETKANPATKPLSADEIYTYYVKDANGCISKPADVKVVVDKAADALAITATADMVNLCLGNVSHFKVSATKGTLSADAEYEWTPSANLTDEKTAEPVFTATTGGNFPYLVTVRDQGKVLVASVTVTVKALQVPEFAWDEPNCTPSYNTVGDPIKVTTKVTKETTKPYTYHWLKPSDVKNELHDYSVQTTTQSQYDFAVVMIDANGCQTADTLKKHIEAGAAVVEIEINAENVSVCAMPEGVDGTATLSVVKTAGPDNVTYDWKPKSGNTLTLTDADKANAIVNLSGVVAGAYTFTVKVSDANDNTNYAEKDVKLTVNKLPVFQIDEHCLALHKDSVFTLNVANTGDYTYLWRVSMYDKSQKQWGAPSKPEGPDNNKYCGDKMSNQDMRYILKVEDNSTSLHCAAFDTAYVYRIPDAPLVEIDTNTSRLNIKLEWATVSGNDGYTVWSRKWDPYCMTSADGGVYKATATPHNILTEAAADTLKFYYVTADRNVCGKTYYSLASDTVGYYLFDVRRNTGKMASINYYPVYFDMKGTGTNGAYRTKDMFALYGNAITLIKKWNFSTQLWEAAQKLPNGVVANDFDIVVGTLLQLDPKGQTHILQYGVLPKGLSALFARTNTGSKANISHSYMWTHRLDLIDTKDFLTEFTGVSLIKYWDFSSQLWVASQMLPNGVIARKFDLKGLMPLQIELKSGVTSVDWK